MGTLSLDGLNRVPGLIRNCGGDPSDQPTSLPLHDITCTDRNELVAFTAAYGASTPTGPGAEVVLDRQNRVVRVAHEAIDTLILSARHVTLRVHPDDHALIAEGAGEVIEARGARVIADAAISRGGCIVESNIGVVDATLETRWSRVVASLGADEEWHGGDAAEGAQ